MDVSGRRAVWRSRWKRLAKPAPQDSVASIRHDSYYKRIGIARTCNWPSPLPIWLRGPGGLSNCRHVATWDNGAGAFNRGWQACHPQHASPTRQRTPSLRRAGMAPLGYKFLTIGNRQVRESYRPGFALLLEKYASMTSVWAYVRFGLRAPDCP